MSVIALESGSGAIIRKIRVASSRVDFSIVLSISVQGYLHMLRLEDASLHFRESPLSLAAYELLLTRDNPSTVETDRQDK